MLLATCGKPSAVPVEPLAGEPDIRVGVAVRAGEVRLEGQGEVAATSDGRPAFRLGARSAVSVKADGRAVVVAGTASGRFESLTFVSLSNARHLELDGKPFRGVIEVYALDGQVMAVNQLSLDAYVAGVVVAEMGNRAANEEAALRAQAVVSRTYALANRGKFGAQGYDVGATVTDQAYGGVGAETGQGWAAVRATAGMVITYDGEIISPFYHSTCGSATASPEESFRTGRATPYLRSVSDRHGAGFYCDISPRFRWTVTWDGPQLADILRRTLPRVVGVEGSVVDAVRDLRVQRTGPSRRITELRIKVGSGDIPVYGPDIRGVLAQPDGRILGSTAFEVATNHGADGNVQRVTVSGAGWGHGVGMCQWGAVGRARAGQDFGEILTTYFPGTRIEKLY